MRLPGECDVRRHELSVREWTPFYFRGDSCGEGWPGAVERCRSSPLGLIACPKLTLQLTALASKTGLYRSWPLSHTSQISFRRRWSGTWWKRFGNCAGVVCG